VTLRTAVSWTLLGVMTMMQGTLTLGMRVVGMMQPFLCNLWVPLHGWVHADSVSGSSWVGALPLEGHLGGLVGTMSLLLWTPHPC